MRMHIKGRWLFSVFKLRGSGSYPLPAPCAGSRRAAATGFPRVLHRPAPRSRRPGAPVVPLRRTRRNERTGGRRGADARRAGCCSQHPAQRMPCPHGPHLPHDLHRSLPSSCSYTWPIWSYEVNSTSVCPWAAQMSCPIWRATRSWEVFFFCLPGDGGGNTSRLLCG